MNWTELDERIDQLEETAEGALVGDASWRDFWNEVKEIGECFKNRDLRYPTHAERNQAWARFQALVSRTKQTRQERSEGLRRDLVAELDAIYLPLGGIFSASVGVVAATFSAVGAPGLPVMESSEKSLLRSAGADLKEVRTRYHEEKHTLTREDNDAVWKRIQQLHDEIQGAWEACEEAEQQGRLSRLHEAKARKEELLERLTDRRARIEDNIAANEERLENARGDEYREKVEGWLEEGREQLEQLNERIDNVEAAIRDIEEKIDGLQ